MLGNVTSERFGWTLMERLQRAIQISHNGELLVGQAHMLKTNEKRKGDAIEYLISAPTMRVPEVRDNQTMSLWSNTHMIITTV